MMTKRKHVCQGCGKDINKEARTCPHCGHKQSGSSEGSAALRRGEELYRGEADDRFRRRPHSDSGSIAEAVKHGGISGNVQVCMKCKHVQKKIRDNCEECGAKLKR